MLEQEAPGDTTAEDPPVYTLGSDPAERDRLRRQSQELGHHATALMDHVGLKPGHEAIDLGCGPVGVIELASRRHFRHPQPGLTGINFRTRSTPGKVGK